MDNPQHGGEACFLTLTFRDEDLPEDYSVSTRDVASFMKMLRQAVVRRMRAGELPAKYGVRKGKRVIESGLRFYAVGEYGEKTDATKRPHYHVIVFGWQPHDMEPAEKSQGGLPQWRSAFLGGVEDEAGFADRSGIWKKGRVRLGKVNRTSIDYCTRYVFDMRFGDQAKLEYGARLHPVTGQLCKVQPPFNHMSRNPGIGHWWFAQFADSDAFADFVIRDERRVDEEAVVPVLNGIPFASAARSRRTTRVLMPRYVVRQIMKPMSEAEEADFKAARRAKAAAAAAERAADNTPARLLMREAVKLYGSASLVRSGGDAVSINATVDALYRAAGEAAEAERNGTAQGERERQARLDAERRRMRARSVASPSKLPRLEAAAAESRRRKERSG